MIGFLVDSKRKQSQSKSDGYELSRVSSVREVGHDADALSTCYTIDKPLGITSTSWKAYQVQRYDRPSQILAS